jgi:nicotinamidase-related amidase
MSNEVITLLLVDVQKDFHPGGTLAIPTADEDAKRIAQLIQEHGSKITRIVATMDSHLKLHIAHPGFWVSGDDGTTHPSPFTIISSQDIADSKWVPRSKMILDDRQIDGSVFSGLDSILDDNKELDLKKYAQEYTKRLEDKGKFKLCIWPEHCLIGKEGHCMVDCIMDALDEWSVKTGGSVEWVRFSFSLYSTERSIFYSKFIFNMQVLKGQNLITESYSALEAEVPVNQETSFATNLQESLEASDRLLVCGQAMSHCVNYTLRSIVERWPKEKFSTITLLTDCASSVPGFEAAGDTFQKDMAKLGVGLQKASEALSPI